MDNLNPATLPQGTAPGASGQSQQTPSATPGQTGGQEGNVTIGAKEYAELQRNNARLQAFQKRAQFTSKNNPQFTPSDNDDPEIVEVLRKEQERTRNLESEIRSERIRNGVREMLDKEDNKVLPKVARDLILKNPALLSKAETADEALVDIEEFIATQVADYKAGLNAQEGVNTQKGGTGQPQNPSGHETPPIVNAANPAPVDVNALEDVDKLQGSNKSRAIVRNLLKKQKQGKGA